MQKIKTLSDDKYIEIPIEISIKNNPLKFNIYFGKTYQISACETSKCLFNINDDLKISNQDTKEIMLKAFNCDIGELLGSKLL